MDFFDLLFGTVAQALQEIFRLGFIPQEDNFLELTDEQYAQFYAKEGESEISIVTESDKDYFACAAEIIK